MKASAFKQPKTLLYVLGQKILLTDACATHWFCNEQIDYE